MRTKEEITTEVKKKIEEATPIVEELLKKYGKIRRTLTPEENIAYHRILGLHTSVDELTSYLIYVRAIFENTEELKRFNKEIRRAIKKEVNRALGRPRFLGKIKNGKLVRKPTTEQVERVIWKRIEKEREIVLKYKGEDKKGLDGLTKEEEEVEINTDALQICPTCGKRNLVLYTAINQPSKLFCLGCGKYWVEVQNE